MYFYNIQDMKKQAIGIFDSGVGGLSIWKEIHQLLPNENTIYLADSKHAPYGPKGRDKIIELSIKNTELLLEKNCKLIVVACNTATTNAISVLREKYKVPFIGIEPAIKPAALQTKTKAIGILATKGTLASALFHETTDLYSKNTTIVERVGEGIVSLIESGAIDSEHMTALLKQYMEPMIAANIDYLVLGCTHYPFLIPQLLKILPKRVKIIDSGAAVAKHTKSVLKAQNLLNVIDSRSEHQFYSNAQNIEILENLLGKDNVVNYLDF